MEGGVEPVAASWDIQGLQEREGYEARVQAKNRSEINIIWEVRKSSLLLQTSPAEKLIFKM